MIICELNLNNLLLASEVISRSNSKKECDQVNESRIEALALQCARAALKKVCQPHLRYMWLDDAKQVAALKLIEIGEDHELGYKKVAARRAVQQWWFEFVIGDKSHRNDGKNRNVELIKKSFDELSGWLQAQQKPATNHPQRI